MYAHDPPELLDDIIDLAIRLDSRMELRCRVRENTSWSRAELSVPSPAPHVSELPDPEPMQVGRMRLTVEEKQRRLSKGFCLHCGGQGHIAAKCPLKANACQYIVLLNGSGVKCLALIDSGAEENFVDSNWAHQNGLPVYSLSSPITAHSLNGHQLMEVTRITGLEEEVDVSQVPVIYHDLRAVFSRSQAASLPPHRPYDCAIDLLPGTSPSRGCLFSLSAPERVAMKKYLSESLAAGLIRPSFSPAGAAYFFVKKKDGSLRPCIDYRGLNDITIKNGYPLPLMSTAFEVLQGAKFFTKLDLRNAYHLVRIREGDEWKTAFNTPTGHFEYLVLPFGLSNAPAIFQALVNDVLRDMINKFVFVYLDDILIFSRSFQVHVQHISRQFVVEVDVSEVGVEAVLSQKSPRISARIVRTYWPAACLPPVFDCDSDLWFFTLFCLD
ncbi:Transposon Tf2-9 polyprotein [Labeo rohita]|uniref:ribonuclease H n=1 Tax=Labeo rohita TaxID=84645 RepID=A0ABQ8M2U2_LABRO|nr:Transposon Tf2-9 polyprotein [Labeo rohita]